MKDRAPLTVGLLVAAPGSRVTGFATIDLGEGQRVDLPILIVHGRRTGPLAVRGRRPPRGGLAPTPPRSGPRR